MVHGVLGKLGSQATGGQDHPSHGDKLELPPQIKGAFPLGFRSLAVRGMCRGVKLSASDNDTQSEGIWSSEFQERSEESLLLRASMSADRISHARPSSLF